MTAEPFSLLNPPNGLPDRVEYFRGGYHEFYGNGLQVTHFYQNHDPGPYIEVLQRGPWERVDDRTMQYPYKLRFDFGLGYLFDMRD